MNAPARQTEEKRPVIVLADDDDGLCVVIRQALAKKGYEVRRTDNGRQLLEWTRQGVGDLVITDVMMPEMNGLDALPRIREARPGLPVIVISAHAALMTAVNANRRGANEYFPKPFDLHELTRCVESLLPKRPLAAKLPALPATDAGGENMPIGASPAMQETYRAIARLSTMDLTVMIEGESGTGKEIVARALHRLGARRERPFVAINMAAIPRELVESELFGHEKGAFTGASARRKGKFAAAEGGTLFLDEIGDMPLDAQAKLLRVLQEGEFTPVGSGAAQKTNVRIVCATHQDLAALCRLSKFREDLYYRLYVVPVRVPPLRERAEDIPLLVAHFLREAKKRGLPARRFDAGALKALAAYVWPGNVRELENAVYRLSALASGEVMDKEHLEKHWRRAAAPERAASAEGETYRDMARGMIERYFQSHAPNLPPPGVHARFLRETEAPLIAIALEATSGNQIQAAHLLGMNRNTLRKKIQELGMNVVKTVR